MHPYIWRISEHIVHLTIVFIYGKSIGANNIPFNATDTVSGYHFIQIRHTLVSLYCIQFYTVNE